MNYYIQGDVAKAEQIKAAFENKGYDVKNWRFTTGVYYTLNGKIVNTNIGSNEYNLVINHPDYKELELPVEPKFKFKVGDWIVRGRGFVYEPSLITEIRDYYVCELLNEERVTYTLNDVHKNFHLWTIADAKDGDVLSSIRGCPFIYDKYRNQRNDLLYYYAGIDGHGDFVMKCPEKMPFHFGPSTDAAPATKEQRDLLFAKMKEEGYEWDAYKKELKKIQSHYDIANFKPKQWVLVRDCDNQVWGLSMFSHRDMGCYICLNREDFTQCIPFEGNETLLGTTDMCDEMYINW